jgi:hypothetical protein
MTHSNNLSRRALLGLAVALGAATLLPATGRAASLGEMLGSGKLGERYDGFVQARDPSAQGFAADVNNKRRGIYEKRANETGQTVDVVGRIYAAELYQKAAPGTWFLLENGSWVQK